MTSGKNRQRKRDWRKVSGLADFTDAEIAALERSETPDEAKAFDDERGNRS